MIIRAVSNLADKLPAFACLLSLKIQAYMIFYHSPVVRGFQLEKIS